jgi:predicted nucleic acid-binding protein
LSSSVRNSLRRLKPEKRVGRFIRRDRDELPFFGVGSPPGQLLLDSTFYIDMLQGRIPDDLQPFTVGGRAWHSAISLGEVAFSLGKLDPRHPGTKTVAQQIVSILERASAERTLVPDRNDWREASIACGVLARTQSHSRAEHRRLLNDCLIFFSAIRHGCAVLTRNIADFDLLLQLMPQGKVVFYEALPR